MLSKAKTDPFECNSDILALGDALDVFSGKWKMMILHYLISRINEVNTFKKIEKDISGISAKMLSKELKYLEANLMVTRTPLNTSPASVAYSISEYGKSAQTIISSLVNWGKKHREIIRAQHH